MSATTTTAKVKPTRGVRRVLLVLLTGADNLSGYPIGRAAAISFASVYNALDRLENAGWITGEFEGQPGARPRRRFYRLTPEGRSLATGLLGLEWHDDDGTCKKVSCPNFGGVWRDCPQTTEGAGDAELERRVARFRGALRRLHDDPAEAARIDAIVADAERAPETEDPS